MSKDYAGHVPVDEPDELLEGFIAHMSEVCKTDFHEMCSGWRDFALKADPCHCYCHREDHRG